MESNAFGNSQLPSQALVVLSEAASGLHEALRGHRPFPSRLPDAKDLHNMSLVGSYGSHLLHSFHPHLLQSLNHGMLANGSAAAAASYFASERAALGKPSVLSNFQLPSAFSPPKYIGISLEQNLFNGSDSFRTDSASPTCTSHESLEGSNDYEATEKGESPRSNASDPRDLRHKTSTSCASSSSASSMAAVSAAAAAAVASIACSTAMATTSPSSASIAHLAHHSQLHHPHTSPHHLSPHHISHPHAHHPHHPHHLASLAAHHPHAGHPHANSSSLLTSMGHSLANLTAASAAAIAAAGLRHHHATGQIPDICPVCGIKITAEEWNSHFLTELDRLYKLSSGMERTNLQATYMFAPPCPSQENAIRTSHNRWETFQRIRNNRQNRLRIKIRKRKYGDMFYMENMFCNSCPICKRKYALETGKLPPDDENKMQDEIETVDVESCNDDVAPDSNSIDVQHHQQLQQMQHAHLPALSGSSSHSHSSHNSSNSNGGGSLAGGVIATTTGANLHSSTSQPGKLDGILYRTACVINSKDTGNAAAAAAAATTQEDDISTNVNTTSTSSNSSSSSANNWPEAHASAPITSSATGHISVKNVSELSSTTHHYYNADSCNTEDRNSAKDMSMEACNNDSDEDVIVDDDESIKMSQYNKKRKYEDNTVGSSRISDNHSPMEERPRSEPQVTSTETSMDHSSLNNNNNNNNNNNTTKYTAFEDLRAKHQHHQLHQHHHLNSQHQHHGHHLTHGQLNHGHGQDSPPPSAPSQSSGHGVASALTQMDSKTGIKDLTTEQFLRGRNFYFHQSCANVMSSYRLSKEIQQQHQQQQQQQLRQHQQHKYESTETATTTTTTTTQQFHATTENLEESQNARNESEELNQNLKEN